ncbi:diguanylate cyclase domain-containing protein [Roseateles sp. BYS180W]|uniref:diguanylate cyclase n=1 Tax=Roseateles rivi TaxID=3299028 RepID=A0ABW7FV77_9BURK
MSTSTTPALLAKAALSRLARTKQEPTPENYARAYAAELGEAPRPEALPAELHKLLTQLTQLGVSDAAQRQKLQALLREQRYAEMLEALPRQSPQALGEALATTLQRLTRELERGGRQWTLARKKDALQRVLDTQRSDAHRLTARLQQLVQSWSRDASDNAPEVDAADEEACTPSQFFEEDAPPSQLEELAPELLPDALSTASEPDPVHWPHISTSLHGTVQHALRTDDSARATELMLELQSLHSLTLQQGANAPRAEQIQALSQRAQRLLDHRGHAFSALGELCQDLTRSLALLAEDDAWAQGQCQAMTQTLEEGLSTRSVRAVRSMLSSTRERQQGLREERSRARESLKSLINRMLQELAELGQHTDRFQSNVGRYAQVIEEADSLETLTDVVREMVEESRSVQSLVQQTQERLSQEHAKADALNRRVSDLEEQLRRLAEEVQTDQLTQIANRRGLLERFAVEQAKIERDPRDLALALLDIDNFKRLNDQLGHAAGDEALKALATRVSTMLRPQDQVGRWGGEEFVLVLPDTPLDEAQAVLLRLQRALSAALFMHEGRDVFVTFSAGLTLYRAGESLEQALERADEGLYEAKRSGKNRCCVAL